MDALLAVPDRHTALGRRDYALLLFLHNTGARADEVAQLRVGNLHLANALRTDHSSVQIRGKGQRRRAAPATARRPPTEPRTAPGCRALSTPSRRARRSAGHR